MSVEISEVPYKDMQNSSRGNEWLFAFDMTAPLRQTVGQLQGRLSTRILWFVYNIFYISSSGLSGDSCRSNSDGTPDRSLSTWLVTAPKGKTIHVTALHQRCGQVFTTITLSSESDL